MNKNKWLKIISEIEGSDNELERLQHLILGGGKLSTHQQKYLLDRHRRSSKERIESEPKSQRSVLNIEEIRDMWRWANRNRKLKMMEDIERIGKYTAKGIPPTSSDKLLISYYKLNMR
jgi:hypothetical protein